MRKIFKPRNIIISLLMLLLLVLIARKTGLIKGDDALKVMAEQPEYRNIIETVSASGKIQPEVQVKISSDVSGEIIEMSVKEGDLVKKGDLLCRIKPDLYLSTIERSEAALNTSKANSANAQARVAQAKAQLINAENNFNRNKSLFAQKIISQQEFDNIKAQFETAKAEVEAAEKSKEAADFNIKNAMATLKEANTNLERTAIYAPVSGKISKLNVENGERVVGTAQMTGTEIMIIANLHEMEVNVEVNENDIVRIKPNDTADIEVDAYLDRKFKGLVTEVANSANTLGSSSDQVTNFSVKIRILRESYENLIPEGQPQYTPFRPGMSATTDIKTNRVHKTLSVPVQSVTTREDTTSYGAEKKKKKRFSENKPENKPAQSGDEEGKEIRNNIRNVQEFVFVLRNQMAMLTPVKTGIQDNNYIQIVSGIQPGDLVITGPYKAVSKTLKNKYPVKQVEKEELFKSNQEEE